MALLALAIATGSISLTTPLNAPFLATGTAADFLAGWAAAAFLGGGAVPPAFLGGGAVPPAFLGGAAAVFLGGTRRALHTFQRLTHCTLSHVDCRWAVFEGRKKFSYIILLG